MADLVYDTELIEDTITAYNECVESMTTLETSMKDMVEDVKKAWKSNAGDAFFEKYNDEWLKGFKQYREVLEHMAENLGAAKKKYEEVTTQAKSLNIE